MYKVINLPTDLTLHFANGSEIGIYINVEGKITLDSD